MVRPRSLRLRLWLGLFGGASVVLGGVGHLGVSFCLLGTCYRSPVSCRAVGSGRRYTVSLSSR